MARYKVRYIKNRPQAIFHADVKPGLLHFSSGFGGGKTFALAMKGLQLSRLNMGLPGGLVCPDLKEFKKDVLPTFEQILDDAKIKFKYHKTDYWFRFPWSEGKLYIVSGEKKIRGPNWAYALINELTLMPLIRYKETIGRVRIKQSPCPQIASCGTPEGFASEYYDYMIEKPPERLRIVYGSTDDNQDNLHEDYIASLEDAYDSRMIDAFRKGLWVNMAGNRFYYSYDPKKCHDTTLNKSLFAEFHVSMDFNVDPMCATVWGFDGYSVYGVDQVELKGDQGFRTENMVEALSSRGYHSGNTIIYPDPAGKARSTKGLPDVVILQRAGYTVRVKGAAPSFRKRQLNVNNLIDKQRVKFNPDLCKGIKKDFEAVEQDIITLEKKKNSPNLTHFSDGFDYMCDILYPFSGDAKGTILTTIR